LEFILRSLLELKLQVEELRNRLDEQQGDVAGTIGEGRGRRRDGWIGDVQPAIGDGASVVGRDGSGPARAIAPAATAIEPPGQPPPPNVVTVAPGMRMADVEKAVIEAALKETKGNRRRAAEMLGIGERTLYRKIKEYRMPEHAYSLD
jgi:DNA-binding NtrC family response regulator